MKTRFGLVLSMVLAAALAGCASGGGGGGGIAGSGADLLSQGERPQQTDNTRAAQQALDDAMDMEDSAQRQALLEQALEAADAAVASIPTNPLAHRQRALALMELGRYDEAAAAFDRAVELRPIYELEDSPMRERKWIELYQSAIPLVNQGQYEEAVELFEGANAIYDQRPEGMFILGQIYAQLRRHEPALENMDHALAIVNDTMMTQGMDSASVATWREQADQVPELRAQVLADAGQVAQGEGRDAEAMDYYRRAEEAFRMVADQDPSNVQALKNVAALNIELGDTAAAFQVYDELVQRPGLSSEDYYQIGVGFYQGDDVARAAAAFRAASEASPRDRDALEMWARSLHEGRTYDDVPAIAQRWIELDPYNRDAYLILATAANTQDDQETASQAVQHIEDLEVYVSNLQITRYGSGGAAVTGSVQNQSLTSGSPVSLQFTFYDAAGNPLGTVDQTVNLGDEGMSEFFRVEFNSMEQVGGYGYDLDVS